MNWSDQLIRIRRMLRDPDGNLWTDAQLRHLYNQEQQLVFVATKGVADVKVLRIPPEFETSYCYDWEWGYSDTADGEVLQWGYFDDPEAVAYTYLWEAQFLQALTPDVPASGEMWVHPWEAWYCDTPAEPPPIPAPDGFHEAIGVYWDKDPIRALTRREVMDDPTWRTRGGDAMAYYRDSKLSDFLILHPMPDVVEWADAYGAQTDPDTAEYSEDALDVDGNLVVFYKPRATDLDEGSDESLLPEYLQRYVEYGVIARAYKANTDGRIASLGEYWTLRRNAGLTAIKRFITKRLADRDYRLETGRMNSAARSRRPRLPDEYPEVYP